VIKGGIPGTGMPMTWQMNDEEIAQVAGYVRELGKVAPAVVLGDPTRGRSLYAANACATCHIIQGQGRGVGPELSDIGVRRGVPYLREAIVDPGAALPVGPPPPFSAGGYIEYLPVRIVSRDGQEVVGMRVNEDTFTIQVRDAGNRFRSFRKHELKVLERQPNRSLMPSYRERLSASQLDDLTAYLSSLRGQP
jgi:putative heme-binding domain-containing protein